VSLDGTTIGTLHNIIVDLETGQLIEIVVKPDVNIDIDTSEYLVESNVEGDFILLPIECIKAIQDFIVIDKKAARIESQARKEIDEKFFNKL
jgi:sporulation protein YlmC with PRC-barrel domain